MRRLFVMASLVGLAIGVVDLAAAENNPRQRSGTPYYYYNFQSGSYLPTASSSRPARAFAPSALTPSHPIPPSTTAPMRPTRTPISKPAGSFQRQRKFVLDLVVGSPVERLVECVVRCLESQLRDVVVRLLLRLRSAGARSVQLRRNVLAVRLLSLPGLLLALRVLAVRVFAVRDIVVRTLLSLCSADLLSLLAALWSGARHADDGGWPVTRPSWERWALPIGGSQRPNLAGDVRPTHRDRASRRGCPTGSSESVKRI